MAVGTLSKRPLPVSNVIIGRSTLVAGTVDVDMNEITEDSLVFVSGNSAAVTGVLSVVITAGDKFSITSSVGGDTGVVAWMVVINPLNPS